MINVAKFKNILEGKALAVLGLGLSNLAAVKACEKQDIAVALWDDNSEKRQDLNGDFVNLNEADMSQFGALLVSPGISESHPAVLNAQKAGTPVMCDIEILHHSQPAVKTIGITGTNGKSTTTALLGHILKENDIPCAIGGNIGTAALSLSVPRGKKEQQKYFVLELSSYQLSYCPLFAPDIAIHLNISSDHIDRHGSMDSYAEAKMRIFRGAGQAIIGCDDAASEKIYDVVEKTGLRQCYKLRVGQEVERGVFFKRNVLHDAMMPDEEIQEHILDVQTLQGAHNHQNIAACYVAAKLCGIAPEDIIRAIQSFSGLDHRQYQVRTMNGVSYINDSKATNVDAACKALAAYKNIYWIAGGRPKGSGLEGIESYLDHIKHVFLIGEAMNDFGAWLDKYGVPHNYCGTMDVAVNEAHSMAQMARGAPGGAGVVLLSPACASFDQFSSFEERGDVFASLVNGLEDEAA